MIRYDSLSEIPRDELDVQEKKNFESCNIMEALKIDKSRPGGPGSV